MKRAVICLALFVQLAAGAQPAVAAAIDRTQFRYERALAADPSGKPVLVEPDGELFEHSLPGFADLRVVDARGRAVAWRRGPGAGGTAPVAVPLLNSGRQGRFAVALLDLGASPVVRDRLMLEVPDREFVGRAVVLGADDRRGPLTRLSATGVYDVRGAKPARSTLAVFPPNDFRYLLVKVFGVSRIDGATVSGGAQQPPLLRRAVRSVSRSQDGDRTIVTLDLGHREIPVDELRITAETARYERPVTISGSNRRRRFTPLAATRAFRFDGSSSAPISVGARHRYIRLEIDNGDDAPLRGIEVSAWSRSRAVLLEGGHRPPFTLYYGSPGADHPSYDFARLPASASGIEASEPGRLGPERENPAFVPPPDGRSLLERHPELVTAALALAALALGAIGLLALRKPT